MWEWLSSLSGGAANFIGSLTGAAIGLIALVIGALFNAHLNRKRDEHLRKVERKALASALTAELGGMLHTLEINADGLEKDSPSAFLNPDLAHSVVIMPRIIEKLTLFDSKTIRLVVDAYILIDQYCDTLLYIGGTMAKTSGHRRLVQLQAEHRKKVVALNRKMISELRRAVHALENY